jgi:predicted RNase H-like HicB family nuclease
MRQYIGLIHKDAESDYGVSFPDFPGVVTAGRTLDEARTLAEEALSFHLEGMVEDGQPIPEPSSLDAVMADHENRNAIAVLVATRDEPTPTARVNITLPRELLAEIDRYARAHGLTRSTFLARAAKGALAGEPEKVR